MNPPAGQRRTGRKPHTHPNDPSWKPLDRVFPQAHQAERALLGAMIMDERARRDAFGAVGAVDFYRVDHRNLFTLLHEMTVRNEHVDLTTLAERVVAKGNDEDYGGLAYVLQMAEEIPSTVNASHYAGIIRDRSLRRQLIALSQNLQELACSDVGVPVLDIRDQLVGKLLTLASPTQRGGWRTFKQVGAKLFDRIIHADPNKPKGISTPFPDLDRRMGLIQETELVVLGGRPAMGKSAMALDIIEHVAAVHGPVAVLSLEMSDEQNLARAISKRMNASGRALMEGSIRDDQIAELEGVVNALGELPVYIDEQTGLTVPEIRTRVEALLAMDPNVCLIVIDYLQIIGAENPRVPRNEQVRDISNALKKMAKDLHIPVLVLSQLNREVAGRADPRPVMSDLAESSAIEKDADRIIAIHRPRYYFPDKRDIPVDLAELHALKARMGENGWVYAVWDAPRTQFSPWPENRPLPGQTPPAPAAPRGRKP